MDYNRKPLAVFLSYLYTQRKLFALDMTCALLVSAIDLVFPYVSKYAMNTLLPYNMYQTFFVVMLIVVAAYFFKSLLYYLITVVGHRMGSLIETTMRNDAFRHMQTLPCAFFDRNRTGVLMARITSDLFDITEVAHHGPENVLISTVTIVGALIIMFTLEWKLALVLTLTLPVCLWFTISQRKAMKTSNVEVKVKTGEITAAIESSISGIRTTKAFANEMLEEEKFAEGNEEYRNAKIDYYKSMGLFHAGMEFSTGIMPVLVIAVGGFLIMRGELDYVTLVTFTLYVSTFTTPVRKLAAFAEQYMAGSTGFSRFLEIMRIQPDIQDAEDAEELTDVEGHIVYDQVCFSYVEDLPVLQDINIDLQPGKTLALVGPTGEGKTTICRLLPRFYDVTSGAVTVDGKDVRKVTQESLRKQIGIIEQEVFMFAGTIKENILYGKPDATDEEIIEAAKNAEIHDEIMQYPDGYDSYIGERGVMLSGGQKQRISIARVFLKNPKILILDEATSALDTVTERKIQQSLDRLSEGRTTLIIAHRLSTISGADEIAVIDGGRLVEYGTHEKLLEKDGRYAKLWRAQMGL